MEFRFDNIMCQQIAGVAMGSPLGPALANSFFVCDFKTTCSLKTSLNLFLISDTLICLLPFYTFFSYTFAIFNNKTEYNQFLPKLNATFLVFTHKKHVFLIKIFFDVSVEKSNKKFLTSLYRKPTFTGQYRGWDSFGPKKKRKTNLIGTPVHRDVVIHFPEKLLSEVSKIKNIFRQNGYPEEVIISGI